MSDLKIEITDGRRTFEPGETINVAAAWRVASPPSTVESRLIWYTRGKGDADMGIVRRQIWDSVQASDSRQCTFELPNGPYSFSGKLISLIWAVELVVEPSGQSERIDITVGPEGHEVDLTVG